MRAETTLVDSIEELAFAAVGMTALALNEAGQEKDLTLPQWRVLVILGRGPMATSRSPVTTWTAGPRSCP